LLAFQQYGPRFVNEAYSTDGIRIVRITDLSESGNLDFSAMPKMTVSAEDRKKYSLCDGDIIFARTGATVGKVALIGPNDPPCIAGAYFITMRFEKTVEPVYARAVLVAPSVRAIVAKRSRQAAQQNFSGPGLRQLPMPLPPLDLQREFARRVAAVEKLKTAQRAALAELDALFASLQHRAFRGEL
jgi:type I restriction enzyme S subunit